MNNAKFGDSHDYVKRGLLLTIAEPDKWIVHPMPFYYDGGGLDLDDYATFLGLPHTSVMGHRNKENRRAHLLSPGNLLQDGCTLLAPLSVPRPRYGCQRQGGGRHKAYNSQPADQDRGTEGR